MNELNIVFGAISSLRTSFVSKKGFIPSHFSTKEQQNPFLFQKFLLEFEERLSKEKNIYLESDVFSRDIFLEIQKLCDQYRFSIRSYFLQIHHNDFTITKFFESERENTLFFELGIEENNFIFLP